MTEFRWQDWINSAMGYIKAAGNVFSRQDARNGTDPRRKRTASRGNLSRTLVTVSRSHEQLPELRRDIQVWTRWSFFDIKIVQFEMNGCMRAEGRLLGFSETGADLYSKFPEEVVRRVEEGLMKMSEWPECKWKAIMASNI